MNTETHAEPQQSLPTSATSALGAPVYDVDAPHTTVGFRVRHMMVSWTQGRFRSMRGLVVWDDQAPARSFIDVEIDASSIDTDHAERDAHLRSADFFDVERFPKLHFTSSEISQGESGGWYIAGHLTIRGVTRPVVLEVTELWPEIKDPWGGARRGASAKARINRREFGLTWNAALELGGVAVGDEVQLVLEIELLRRARETR